MGVGFQGIQDDVDVDVDEDDDVVVAGFGIALHLPATPRHLPFSGLLPLVICTWKRSLEMAKGGHSQMVH